MKQFVFLLAALALTLGPVRAGGEECEGKCEEGKYRPPFSFSMRARVPTSRMPVAPRACPIAVPPPKPAPPRGVTTGSLYTDSSAGFYEDGKARKVGDIVTITVSEKAEASKQASTKTGRKKDLSTDLSFAGLTTGDTVVLDTLKTGYSGKFDNTFTGTRTSTRKDSMTTYMTATIVEVLPNGNLAIRGSRWTKEIGRAHD